MARQRQWARASSFTRFLDHTQLRNTFGRTPLKEWSARRRDLYLTTHNTHNRQTSMSPVGFEATVSTCERPQTYALDCAATWTGKQAEAVQKFNRCVYYRAVPYGKSSHNNCNTSLYWVVKIKNFNADYPHIINVFLEYDTQGFVNCDTQRWDSHLPSICYGYSSLRSTTVTF
jgi:hypothetical protein